MGTSKGYSVIIYDGEDMMAADEQHRDRMDRRSYEVDIGGRFDHIDRKLEEINRKIDAKADHKEMETIERDLERIKVYGSPQAQNAITKVEEMETLVRNLGWKFVMTLAVALGTVVWEVLSYVASHK